MTYFQAPKDKGPVLNIIRQTVHCPACGALPRYIIQGVCRQCGHAIETEPTEWRGAL